MGVLNHTDIANTLLDRASRVTVKFGSACIVDPETCKPRSTVIQTNVDDLTNHILNAEKQLQIVTSGAIPYGRNDLNFSATQELTLPEKQACASSGQISLIDRWRQCFSVHDRKIGQVLLVPADLVGGGDGGNALMNYRNLNDALLKVGAVPVANENDVTATTEIRFGDNDKLSVQSAIATSCDLVIFFSKDQGFYDRNPNDEGAQLHSVITEITDEHYSQVSDLKDCVSTGGGNSKLDAAKIALAAGVPVIWGRGVDEHSLEKLLSGENSCTCFVPPALLKQFS